MDTCCVIGIGCDDHGDQIAGLLVAREIAVRSQWPTVGGHVAGPEITAIESAGAPAHLVQAWRGCAATVVVEAMPGDHPGDVHRCQPHPRRIGLECPAPQLSSRLRDALLTGPLPQRLTIITIEAQCFARDAAVTPLVAQAAARVAADLLPHAQVALAGV